MPLFNTSNNKSQASLEPHADSRDRSPAQSEPAYPHTQVYSGAQPPPQLSQHPEFAGEDKRYYRTQATVNSSIQSPVNPSVNHPTAGAVDSYSARDHQPTVIVNPPLSPSTVNHQAHNTHSPLLPSPPSRIEPPPKKSRGFLGFSRSKKEDKREDKESAGNRGSVGRAPSLLKKAGQQPPHQQLQTQPPSSPQSPEGLKTTQLASPDSRANIYLQNPIGETSANDSERYEEHYQQKQLEGQQDPSTRTSIRYVGNTSAHDEQPVTPRHIKQASLQSQRPEYPPYHQTSASNSSSYLPNPQLPTPSLHPLRSPSQQSFGPPPSPVGGQPASDSRPPTASNQSKYANAAGISQTQLSDLSHQRQPSQDQSRPDFGEDDDYDDSMVRGEPPNGSVRPHRDDDRQPMYPSQQDPRVRAQGQEHGRSTPPPHGREDLTNLDYSQLLQKHTELAQKYSKVKRYYFEREDQVKQLQNTVASQRLSMSKTSLDDAQYITRFERLNGAIQNLSFNIRKEWRRVPNWLTPVCNRNACETGTKEMTAVGRACMTRWVYENIFERVFHPGIDQNLSIHLKTIERSLRRTHYGSHLTPEQHDDLMVKIMTWRLTTIEGLSDILNSRQAESYTENLTHVLTREFSDYLRALLSDPPPPGLLEGLYGIVSQALGICANIPNESRDVCIDYYLPATHLNEVYMKVEGNMTALVNPGSAPSAADHVSFIGQNDEDDMSTVASMDPTLQSQAELEAQIREATGKAGTSPNPAVGSMAGRTEALVTGQVKPDSKSKALFGGLRLGALTAGNGSSGKAGDQQTDGAKADGTGPDAYNIHSLTGNSTGGKIRFAVFLAVEVRGRTVLVSKDEKNEKKDGGDKGAESAGIGQSAGDRNADKLGINILYKAPVYIFDG